MQITDLTDKQLKELTDKLARPSDLVEAVCRVGGEPVVLDEWQRWFVNTEEPSVIWNKGRQVGWSFAAAGRMWTRSLLRAPGTSLSVPTSYNLEDAKEKIRYIKLLDDSLPVSERLQRIVDSKMELEFENKNRIVTMFMPRGKGPADSYLDELAFMQEAQLIYQSAIGMQTRGGGRYIGSTPLGKYGMFYDIFTGAGGKFSKFIRIEIPWWRSSALCVNVPETFAQKLARSMPTAERVARWGTPKLQEIFDNMFDEDFQTEYECRWCDEITAFLLWELIERCSPTGDNAVHLVHPPVSGYETALASIDYLRGLGPLYAGMDVGRKIDATEIKVAESLGREKRIEERLSVTLKGCPFPKQQRVVDRILSLPNMKKFVIDHNGLGGPIAEKAAEDWPGKVVSQVLSRTTKPELANNLRVFMEKDMFTFYPERDTRQQMHSVKKMVTAHGNVTYDTDRNEKHHADKFWAFALMLWGAKGAGAGVRPSICIIGGRDPDVGENEIILPGGITADPRKLS